MSAGTLRTTPWTDDALRYFGIDRAAIAARIPSGYSLHITERNRRGPWYVRLFRVENGVSRELTHFNKTAPGSPDLGHAVDYVLAMAEGAAGGS